MLVLSLDNVFFNISTLPENGIWFVNHNVENKFTKKSLSDYLSLPQDTGVYVVYSHMTNEFFVGNAKNFKERVKNLLITIRNGTCGNPAWVKTMEAANSDLGKFSVICLHSNDPAIISEIQSKLMAEFRNRGLLINKYYAPKVVGVIGNREYNTYACYVFKNKRTGQYYVGSCKNPKNRKHQHLKDMREGKHANRNVQAAWNADPNADNWEWITHIHRNKLAARNHEQLWLNKSVGIDPLCLNISGSATDHVNSCATEESIARARAKRAESSAERTGYAVIVDGKEYPSIGLAALAIGVNQSTVSRWVANPDNPRAVYVNPEEAAARGSQLRNLHAGARRKLTEDHHGAKKILVGDRVFDTMNEACRVLGVCEKTLRKQARDPLNSQVKWVK